MVGATKAETTAIKRAGDKLASAGKVVLVRLWNSEDGPGRRVCTFALPPGFDVTGLSVDRVTSGTRSTLKGSIRNIAAELHVSPTMVWRDMKKAPPPTADAST